MRTTDANKLVWNILKGMPIEVFDVDLMVQAESLRESMAELKKDIKNEYGIPVATITKIASIVRKQNLDEEEEKWAEIKEYVDACS